MNVSLVAAMVLGMSLAFSGWFILQGPRARLSGAVLVVAGTVTLVGCAAVALDVDDLAPTCFRVVGCLLLPAALIVYPRASWRDPLSFILLVVVIASGVLAATWADAFEPLGYVILSGLAVHAWWAYERSEGDDRRALSWSLMAWIAAGLVVALTEFVAESISGSSDTPTGPAFIAIAALPPVAMVIGAVRPELVDVRGLVTRSVVAATVLMTYIAAAVGINASIEVVNGKPLEVAPVIVVCALLAFGVRPLQVMLRGVVDHLLFGDRPDPLAAATSLADRIGDDPSLALDAIREALVLPYASLRAGGVTLASSGSKVTHTRTLPLRLEDDEVGEVVVGLRAGDLGLSPADADVLRIVAPLLAQTLRARALSKDLQASKEAVVVAVEEERRRLRRDLHDGLGPTLSGVAFATDAARNQLRSDPERAEELLALLRADTAGAISEIRRLVEGLRPPALDELGLVGAVRQHAASLHTAAGTPLDVTVDVPDALPPLAAATEVAAFRIVVEALTNAARHAAASAATVTMTFDDEALSLSVLDDGKASGEWEPGMGISSMRERAHQLGGTLTISGSDGGLVRASIPLPS